VSTVDFSGVAAPTTLHACYSPDNTTFYPAGTSTVQVMVRSFEVTSITPQTAQEDAVLSNVALAGTFCPNAPKPTVALSPDPTCPLASLMARASVTTQTAQVREWTRGSGQTSGCIPIWGKAQVHVT
jgi:hypothetical protein